MKKHLTILALALAAGALVLSAQQAAARRGQTYADLAKLPDWSGAYLNWGMASGVRYSEEQLTYVPPFINPDNLAKTKQLQTAERRQIAGGVDNQLARARGEVPFGAPAAPAGGGRGGGVVGFNGVMNLGPTGYLEVLFTPGRVTIITTNNTVRRIYTDGTVADPSFISAQGTSIGHWEGDTLVVDTIGLNPKTTILGVAQAGEGYKVHERIFMKDKAKKGSHTELHCPYKECDGGVLEIDSTLEAPEVLSKPFQLTPQYFAHAPYRHELIVDYTGEPGARDRSIDPKTGGQTFDLTPPSDIPPPPPTK